jgi:hypothetical protein
LSNRGRFWVLVRGSSWGDLKRLITFNLTNVQHTSLQKELPHDSVGLIAGPHDVALMDQVLLFLGKVVAEDAVRTQ